MHSPLNNTNDAIKESSSKDVAAASKAEAKAAKEKASTSPRTAGANDRPNKAATNDNKDKPFPDFPFDSTLLKLTEEERRWTKAIKKALGGLPDLDIGFSDFMCANLAIAGKGDLEWAVAKAYKMQEVHKKFDIRGTFEEGKKAIGDLMDLLPTGIMSFNYNPHSGHVSLVIDATCPVKEVWNKKDNIDLMIKACYYLCYAEYSSFACMRKGQTHAFDFDGYKLGFGMVDIKEAIKMTNCTVGAFPSVLNEIRLYNTPHLANVLLRLILPCIPKEIGAKLKMGCTFSGGKLENFYKVPTAEAARERAYLNLCSALKIRMESEKAFTLEAESKYSELCSRPVVTGW